MLAVLGMLSVVCMVGPLAVAAVPPAADDGCAIAKVCVNDGPVYTVQICDGQAKLDCCKSKPGTTCCFGQGICILEGPHGTKQIVCGSGKPGTFGRATGGIGSRGLVFGGLVPGITTAPAASGLVYVIAGGDDEGALEAYVDKDTLEAHLAGYADDLAARHVVEPKAWLGVSTSPVPEALKAHINRGGLMIDNVVADSPADEAGLERYDVVVSFNGKPIEQMDDLLEAIADAGEGNTVKIMVIRKGNERTLTITPGKRPEPGDWEYKYEEPEEEILDDEFSFRGHRLHLGPGGDWIFEPLGRLRGLPEPLRGFRWFTPGNDDDDIIFRFDAFPGEGDDAEIEIKIVLDEDGEKLMIHRTKDGQIEVERTNKDGETSSATYDNVEEFEKEDPDAYEHYRGVRVGDKHRWIFRYPDLGDLPKLQKQYQKQIELKLERAHDKLREAHEKAGQAGEEARKTLERWVEKKTGEAQLDITVNDDGSIKVVVEKDGTRVVYEFANKDDFKQREPELFDKFRDTLK